MFEILFLLQLDIACQLIMLMFVTHDQIGRKQGVYISKYMSYYTEVVQRNKDEDLQKNE